MKITRRIIKTLFALGLIAVWLTGCFMVKQHPTAQQLIVNFRNNQADFERLLLLFKSDNQLGRVAYDFTRSASFTTTTADVPPERLNTYRALFTRLHLEAGIEGYGDKRTVYFIASTQGLSVSGSAKGYVYSIDRPEPVVENIDAYWPADGRSFTAYQLIEGNWYLYFEYED